MARKATLESALDAVTPPPITVPVPEVVSASRAAAVKPSREGTSLVGAHLPKRYGKALKLLAAETEETQAALMQQALDMLFIKKGVRV